MVSAELEEIQSNLLKHPTSSALIKENDLSEQFMFLRHAGESFFKQKSRVTLFNAGDSNTAFFHRAVKVKCAKNTIRVLHNSEGVKLTSIHDIQQEATHLSEVLLGTRDPNASGGTVHFLMDLLKVKLAEQKIS